MKYAWEAPNGTSRQQQEHRRVASEKIGRVLTRQEHVHHINGAPWDNSPDNLEVLTPMQHHRLHHGTDLRFPGSTPVAMEFRCGCRTVLEPGWTAANRVVARTFCDFHAQMADDA